MPPISASARYSATRTRLKLLRFAAGKSCGAAVLLEDGEDVLEEVELYARAARTCSCSPKNGEVGCILLSAIRESRIASTSAQWF